jgi:hypothetical protein
LTAKVTVAVGEADAARVWDGSGATSMRAWLSDEGLAGPDAHRLAGLAAHVHRLPVLRDAWLGGEVSNGQVRAIDAQLTSRNVCCSQSTRPAWCRASWGCRWRTRTG